MNNIKIGDKVKNRVFGFYGTILEIIEEDRYILIKWDGLVTEYFSLEKFNKYISILDDGINSVDGLTYIFNHNER